MKSLFSSANTLQLHHFQQLHWEGPYELAHVTNEKCVCIVGHYVVHIEGTNIIIEQCYERFLLITVEQLKKVEMRRHET